MLILDKEATELKCKYIWKNKTISEIKILRFNNLELRIIYE